MNEKKILYTMPSITELEINYVTDAIKNGWGEKCYDYIYKLQDSFKNYLNVKYCLPTSSCTGALHLALASLGVNEGDEVIVPDITWIASVAPVIYLGAKPKFVDILPDTWCINPQKIEKSMSPKTKAIIVVHLYGNLVEMDEILEIAKKYNIAIVEDSAEALGSEYKGIKAGAMGDFGVFSFHGTKTMTTGEGGMLVTNNKNLYEKAMMLNDHGRNPQERKMFWSEKIGYKYKMSNLQAALGCAQLKRIGEIIEKKRQIFKWYKSFLKDIQDLKWNPEAEYVKNSFWMPTVIYDNCSNFRDRYELVQKMIDVNIQVRSFFYPISSLPMFKNNYENKVSYDVSYRGLNLPSYYDLNKSDVQYVSECLSSLLKR